MRSITEWTCPFANTSSPLSAAWSTETFRLCLLCDCWHLFYGSRSFWRPVISFSSCHLTFQSPKGPVTLNHSFLCDGNHRWRTRQVPDLPTAELFSLYSLGEGWGKNGETRAKMQMYYNRQLHQKQMSMNNSPVGFSSSLIPFSTWSSGTQILQARITVSQGLGWIKCLSLQDWEMDFHSKLSKPTYASSTQVNKGKPLIHLCGAWIPIYSSECFQPDFKVLTIRKTFSSI